MRKTVKYIIFVVLLYFLGSSVVINIRELSFNLVDSSFSKALSNLIYLIILSGLLYFCWYYFFSSSSETENNRTTETTENFESQSTSTNSDSGFSEETSQTVPTYPDVSPDINPTQKDPETYHLLSESDSLMNYLRSNARAMFASILCLLSGLGAGGVIVFHFIPNGFPDVSGEIEGTSLVINTPQWFDVLFFNFAFLLVLSVGIFLVYKNFRRLPALLFFQPGRIQISKWPLKLGESTMVRYERNLPSFFNLISVTPHLVCQSSLKIALERKMNNVRTSKIYDEEFPSFRPGKSQGGKITDELEITIPAWAPPSFDTPERKYEWFIEYEFEFNVLPGDTSRCKLHVLPELKED